MPKLYSSSTIIKVLERKGFFLVSQKGSHMKFRKTLKEETITAIVPANKKEVPCGTFKSILRQSKLSEEEFTQKK